MALDIQLESYRSNNSNRSIHMGLPNSKLVRYGIEQLTQLSSVFSNRSKTLLIDHFLLSPSLAGVVFPCCVGLVAPP